MTATATKTAPKTAPKAKTTDAPKTKKAAGPTDRQLSILKVVASLKAVSAREAVSEEVVVKKIGNVDYNVPHALYVLRNGGPLAAGNQNNKGKCYLARAVLEDVPTGVYLTVAGRKAVGL